MPVRKIAFEENPESEDPQDVDDVEDVEDDVEDETDDDIELEDDDDDVTLPDLMQTFFAGENGKNLVDTIEGLKKSIDNQNKVLMKIGALMEKYFSK